MIREKEADDEKKRDEKESKTQTTKKAREKRENNKNKLKKITRGRSKDPVTGKGWRG